jgi:hypothetical protein
MALSVSSAFISGEICFCEKQLATYLPQERETAGFNYHLPNYQFHLPRFSGVSPFYALF